MVQNVNEINAPSPILSSGPPISYDEKYDANNVLLLKYAVNFSHQIILSRMSRDT